MIRLVLLVGLAAHLAVAIWNGFFGPSFGAEGDALAFHEEAVYYANNLQRFEYVTGWVYTYFLGILYRIFTDHIFFGSLVSVAAWLISAILVGRTMEALDQPPARVALSILVFSLWPSAILNTSVTLREAFQVLGVNCIIYASILNFWKGKRAWFLLGFGMLLVSVLHGALLVFSAASFVYSLYFLAAFRLGLGRLGQAFFVFLVGGIGISIGLALLDNIAYSLDEGLLTAIQSHNEGASSIAARADYRYETGVFGFTDLIFFVPVAFAQFMLEPLPGRIATPADALLFGENLVRFAMLIFAFVTNQRLPRPERAPHTFILMSFIGLSLIWSIGTVNWGTASRHQAPGLMMVVVAALYLRRRPERRLRITSAAGRSPPAQLQFADGSPIRP